MTSGSVRRRSPRGAKCRATWRHPSHGRVTAHRTRRTCPPLPLGFPAWNSLAESVVDERRASPEAVDGVRAGRWPGSGEHREHVVSGRLMICFRARAHRARCRKGPVWRPGSRGDPRCGALSIVARVRSGKPGRCRGLERSISLAVMKCWRRIHHHGRCAFVALEGAVSNVTSIRLTSVEANARSTYCGGRPQPRSLSHRAASNRSVAFGARPSGACSPRQMPRYQFTSSTPLRVWAWM